jgi:ATP-dependent DNA helicase RecQ
LGSGYNTYHEFGIDKFCHTFKHFPLQVDSALTILARAGYIEYGEERENRARVRFITGRDDLYMLNSLNYNENKVITSLLRSYSGLFTDYGYIDESFIAQQTELSPQDVYQVLKGLDSKHIISFIPQRKTPYIRYTRSREEMSRLVFPPEIYSERKKQYEERVKEVIEYATNNSICRSRQLLKYFGEKSSHDCHQCDVCQALESGDSGKEEIKSIKGKILNILSDDKFHSAEEIKKIKVPFELLDRALEDLLYEEDIYLKDGLFIKA